MCLRTKAWPLPAHQPRTGACSAQFRHGCMHADQSACRLSVHSCHIEPFAAPAPAPSPWHAQHHVRRLLRLQLLARGAAAPAAGGCGAGHGQPVQASTGGCELCCTSGRDGVSSGMRSSCAGGEDAAQRIALPAGQPLLTSLCLAKHCRDQPALCEGFWAGDRLTGAPSLPRRRLPVPVARASAQSGLRAMPACHACAAQRPHPPAVQTSRCATS